MNVVLLDQVKTYISGLSSEAERSQIEQYLERQQDLRFIIREPVSKPLGGGIYEIRPGPHRLLFVFLQGHIVVVHAFRKKTRTTPPAEISRAERTKYRYMRGEIK